MDVLEKLKKEITAVPASICPVSEYHQSLGFREHFDDPVPIARAWAIHSLFTRHEPHIYENDRIAGSIRGNVASFSPPTHADLAYAQKLTGSYGHNSFITNADHFAPDYETLLAEGVPGILAKIAASREAHREDIDAEKKLTFLRAAEISMQAFGSMLLRYGERAEELSATAGDADGRRNMQEIAAICRKVSAGKPETFREALQLVWMTHVAFILEGRYAMALGRLDQYLFPFYQRDIAAGRLTRAAALELMECTLFKIGERRWLGGDDVVNIAIGGLDRSGCGAVNDLSYIILEAVERCGIPGPNLSARLYNGVSDEFLDACLRVIGTGLGYPALFNDEINIPALHRHGYALEDCRDYCMVGCIENFLSGRQPPWSDGRYNSPKYLELALNDGRCMRTGVQLGPHTGDPAAFSSMQDLLDAVIRQMEAGAAEYMALFRNENNRYNREAYTQPFLSCFCRDCIARGKDINDGGAIYPSVHGAGCMGIATMADSLAAIEKVVYKERSVTLPQLCDALAVNFAGFERLRQRLLDAPKYGNGLEEVDRYAVWFVETHERIFSRYRTPDGGPVYTAIASNIQNVTAGLEIGATPDGRMCGEPLSDAASPMHGMDLNGPTAVVLSTTRPDYTLVSCGTVLNQKYSPTVFQDKESRSKLLSLIKTYFRMGGQEMQINAVSRDMLKDAMNHPKKYGSLVVRVSGFSAYFTSLEKDVQLDILKRTEHK